MLILEAVASCCTFDTGSPNSTCERAPREVVGAPAADGWFAPDAPTGVALNAEIDPGRYRGAR
jgi:hypothetical protein